MKQNELFTCPCCGKSAITLFLDKMDDHNNFERLWYERAKPDEIQDLIETMYCIVFDANRINAQPVKHEKWKRNASGELECSNCGYVPKWDDDKFCAGCGAKMDGENDA